MKQQRNSSDPFIAAEVDIHVHNFIKVDIFIMLFTSPKPDDRGIRICSLIGYIVYICYIVYNMYILYSTACKYVTSYEGATLYMGAGGRPPTWWTIPAPLGIRGSRKIFTQ